MRRKLKRKISLLPRKPGAYLFKDRGAKALYVGKAADLASRVRSHFGTSSHLGLKPGPFLGQVYDIDYLVTDSELEALLLECNLIKEYRPPYNVRLKDDKKYPFLKLTFKEEFPRLFVTRNFVSDGSRYFGPYSDVSAMRKTISLMKAIFPLRTCPGEKPGRIPGRPCLNFHIKRCLAPCVGKVGKERYRGIAGRAARFLGGSGEDVLSSLREEMREVSDRLDFERAAMLRDKIADIEATISRQKVAGLSERETDVLGVSKSGKVACGVLLRVRDGKVIAKEKRFFVGVENETEEELTSFFLGQYYDRADLIPQRILCSSIPPEIKLLEAYLCERSKRKVSVIASPAGRERGLLRLARMNADLEVAEKVAASGKGGKRIPEEVFELERVLGLKTLPRRIEAFDISTVHGEASVGSLVVFVDGKPRRAEYRKFRIKSLGGPDDTGMMFEVLSRRLKKLKEEPLELPDLLLVDGGKPQVGAAVRAMFAEGVEEIPVFGIAKRNEELYSPYRRNSIRLPRSSQALKLLQRIRDESHRFAISYHRKVMRKRVSYSLLDELPGIGKKKKEILLRRFGSVDRIREATVEELMSAKGVGAHLARMVYEKIGFPPGKERTKEVGG